jgi:hypothetical protein
LWARRDQERQSTGYEVFACEWTAREKLEVYTVRSPRRLTDPNAVPPQTVVGNPAR